MAKRIRGGSDEVIAYRWRGRPAAPGLRVFINYRREETAGHAGRLYDELAERFGEEHVFMDVDTIEPGVDFTEAVREAVGACDAFVAVIGRQWVQVCDRRGRRRLDNPEDFVRVEIEAALDRGVRLIPALVQEAEMPSSDELPDCLAPLARRNALNVSDDRWRYDVGRLVAALERLEQEKAATAGRERQKRAQPPAAPVQTEQEPSRPPRRPEPSEKRGFAVVEWSRRVPRRLVFAVGGLAVFAIGVALAYGLTGSPEQGTASPRAAAVQVPRLIGLPQARAISRLRQLGLRATVVRVRGAGRKGNVLSQAPAQGRSLAPGSAVRLRVAAGPKPEPVPTRIAVPRFERAPGAATVTRLRRRGVRIRVERVFSNRPEGSVLAQRPRAGERVRKGTTVRLTVSAGSAPVRPPSAPPPASPTPAPQPSSPPPPSPPSAPPAPPPPPPPTVTGGGSD